MDEKKCWGLWRMGVTRTLQIFRLYGMGVYIPEVVLEVENLTRKLQDDSKHMDGEDA